MEQNAPEAPLTFNVTTEIEGPEISAIPTDNEAVQDTIPPFTEPMMPPIRNPPNPPTPVGFSGLSDTTATNPFSSFGIGTTGLSGLGVPSSNTVPPPLFAGSGLATGFPPTSTRRVATPPPVPSPSSRWLLTPRSSDLMFRHITKKESRPTDTTLLRKLRSDATTALSTPFSLLPIDDSDEQVANNYSLHMRISELKRRLEQYDMQESFEILTFASPTSDVPLNKTISLLDNWDAVTESMIAHHIRFLRRYGQVWDVQNLDWSLELMENSCEDSLNNKLREDLLGCPIWKSSGPYLYYLMIRRIVSSTEAAVTAMTERIKNMKLTSFEGENVTTATGQLKMAVLRLDTINKLPSDINSQLLQVMQTSSVQAFTAFFLQLERNMQQISVFNLNPIQMGPDSILDLANSGYLEMKELGDWTKS